MNDQDVLLRIQAFVDGELSDSDQAEVAALAARDEDVHALIKELKQTRQALASHDEALELPESREFYWSKIQRQIGNLEPVQQEEPGISLVSILARWLVPGACLAGLLAMGIVYMGKSQAGDEAVNWQAAYDGVNALTYRDYDEGMTVLWLTYPADNTVANSDETGTIN